jgi:RHS repeat-associated protein
MSSPAARPRPAPRPPEPAPPLIGPTGFVTLDCAADAINTAAAPFMSAPPAEQGAAGVVSQYLGGALGLLSAPQMLIDSAFAGLTAPVAALFPAMPAITLLGLHLGIPHTHVHPPSLIPPAPPIPLPSMGPMVGSGAMSVLACGLPIARAGDIGMGITCGSLAPPFEVFTGSSNVFVGGARAARLLDITTHCNPTAMSGFDLLVAVAGVVAGAAGAVATGQSAAALQAAADAAVLAIKQLCGKDPSGPPGVGALVGPPTPTVMIGGFPCPPVGDMIFGALMRKLTAPFKKLFRSKRCNGHCADGSHPIYLVTGENFDSFTDFVSGDLFEWKRHYTTARAHVDGPLGFGFRHHYQRTLEVRLHEATFVDWDGVALVFPKFGPGRNLVRSEGYRLTRIDPNHYELAFRDEPTMIFAGDPFAGPLALVGMGSQDRELLFEYDEQGNLTTCIDSSRSDPRDRRVYEFQLDAAGRIMAITEGAKSATIRFACTYTGKGELARARDAAGGNWAYEYDAEHRWTRQTDPRDYSYSFHYDSQGRCVWASGQDGLWHASVEYFPEDRYTRYTEGDDAVWEFHYDRDGIITKIINPQGGVKVREQYDDGRVSREIDPGGRELKWLYDADGAHYARVDRFGYVYPPELEMPKLADPFARELPSDALAWHFGGAIETNEAAMLGATGRLLDEIPAELHHLARSVFRLHDGSTALARPCIEHDPLGRKLLEVDPLGRARRWEYDAAGNLIAEVDRDGRVRGWSTTSWNLVGGRVDPLGHVTHYQWSSLEQMVGLQDPLGNTTRWDYDKGERLTRVWRDGLLRDVYEYDIGDHFVAKYDGEGRLIFRNAEFHANHFVRRRELASGGEHRYDYDARGRIIEASTEAHDVRMGFDLLGRRTLDLRDGEGLVRRYEAEGREHVRLFERFDIAHERVGDRHRIVTPTGAVIEIRSEHDGVVLRRCSNGTLDWQQYDHEGRLEGRVTSKRDARGEWSGWATRYYHSAEGDLLYESDSARGITRYQFDAAHRLIEATLPSGERLLYEYDAADNLTSKPGLSRLELGVGNQAWASALEMFEHDDRDRLAVRRHREGRVTRYHYDSFDMLVRVEFGDTTWRAGYDAIGRRLWTQHGEHRREFWWDGDRLAAEQGPDGKLRIYIYGGPEALSPIAFVEYASREAEPEAGHVYHVFGNGVGMPLHIEDEHGEIVWWAQHIDPYGALDVHPGSKIEHNLRWPGHYFDAETGLHYNRYRYYDPGLGRYLQSDPIGYRGSDVNLYAYCTNPLTGVDLFGLSCKTAKGDSDTAGQALDGRDHPPPSKSPKGSSVPRGKEILRSFSSLNDARADARTSSGLGDDAVPFIAELGPHQGRVVGAMSPDGKRGWRLDWDESKGFHVNWWNKTAGNKRADWVYGANIITGGTHDDFLSRLQHFPQL